MVPHQNRVADFPQVSGQLPPAKTKVWFRVVGSVLISHQSDVLCAAQSPSLRRRELPGTSSDECSTRHASIRKCCVRTGQPEHEIGVSDRASLQTIEKETQRTDLWPQRRRAKSLRAFFRTRQLRLGWSGPSSCKWTGAKEAVRESTRHSASEPLSSTQTETICERP
jgi:hypothetical protein